MSSSIMPTPSGSSSNFRSGGGFKMSKQRKSIKLAKTYFQLAGASVSGSNCPATSSITTNPGSFFWLSRATIVAAGIPIIVVSTAAAAALMWAYKELEFRNAKYQISPMNAEAHDPGPGRSSPEPKNVAMIHAQDVRRVAESLIPVAFISGAVGVLIFGGAVGLRFFQLAGWFLEQIRIEDRRADFVSSAGPFAQVNEATAIAAEREVLIAAQNDRPASRATQANYLSRGHSSTTLKDAGN